MRSYCAVLDIETKAVIALGTNPGVMVQVQESTPEAILYVRVESPNYLEDFPLARLERGQYPEWVWSRKHRTFTHNDTPPTPEVRARSVLAMFKVDALSRIARKISRARSKLRAGVDFEESVAILKRTEVQRFKDIGYDETRIFEFPFLMEYAEYAGVSHTQAANDIALASRMEEEILAKTEIVRLKYVNLVKKAGTKDEIDKILIEFDNIDASKTRV